MQIRREPARNKSANSPANGLRALTAEAGGEIAETLADAAVQLRRLVVMAEEEPRPHALLASPGAPGLVASVLAVVEREADAA